MNANHVLFWELFLSLCSIFLAIALGTHFWFLRKKHRARKEKAKKAIARKGKKSGPRKKGRGKRRK